MRRHRTPNSLRRVSDFITSYLQVWIFFLREPNANAGPNSGMQKEEVRRIGMERTGEV
jgi:hypothetical protein